MKQKETKSEIKVRLDKWLWAARFYKTRLLAKQAISAGKVRYNGQKPKVGKAVEINAIIEVSKGNTQQVLKVKQLSAHRGSAVIAAHLYEETLESIAARQQASSISRAQYLAQPDYGRRPDKQSRRQRQDFKRKVESDE